MSLGSTAAMPLLQWLQPFLSGLQVQLSEELLDLPGPIVEHGEYNISLRIRLGEGARARLLVSVLPAA